MQDKLIFNENCYQAGLTGDGSDVKYQEASDFCKTEMKGTLAREDKLDSAALFLAAIRPDWSSSEEFHWWVEAGTGQCRTASSDGSKVTLTDEDCEGTPPNNVVRRPLCELGEAGDHCRR